MEFLDRKKEMQRLQRSMESPKVRFIVIYGRRRLGKSTMIKQLLGEKDVYFEADLNEPVIQIELLAKTMRLTYPHLPNARYESWDDLLMAFNTVCKPKCTLCLDEFPYLVKKTPAMPSILQRLIDSGELRFNIIICGSSQRMMKRMIINSSEPLYGRADEKICLRPIPLPYWKEAMGLTARESVEEYSIWGGIPRYWVLREEYGTMWEAVENLILDPHGQLSDEPSYLFFDDTSEPASYSSIMNALGAGNHRYSSLADAIGKRVTELSVPLKNLAEMNFIRKEVPFGENEEKSRKTLYQFADPFMAFYYRFVATYRSYLAMGHIERVREMIVSGFNAHVGKVWEWLCSLAVSFNSIGSTEWGMASRWWNRETELDVVAKSLDGKRLLIGECKWTAPDYADRLFRALIAKTKDIKEFQGYEITYVLFLREKPKAAFSDSRLIIMHPEEVISLLPR